MIEFKVKNKDKISSQESAFMIELFLNTFNRLSFFLQKNYQAEIGKSCTPQKLIGSGYFL
jgi:hypothetical protein